MTQQRNDLPLEWWAENLHALDTEIARLAMLCQVRILAPGAIERVLSRDASVCGKDNAIAFAKLHAMLMMHFAIREKSADSIGQLQTARVETYVIDRLKQRYADLLAP
jgi:hypothetical protein